EIVEGALRHIENSFNAGAETIKALEELHFIRQVVLDRLPDARIQKFGVRRGVEKSVEIGCIIENVDVAIRSGLPLDQRQEPARITFQHAPIFVGPFQDRRRNREMDSGGVEPAPGQYVMHQVPMDAPVSVREWMDIDK